MNFSNTTNTTLSEGILYNRDNTIFPLTILFVVVCVFMGCYICNHNERKDRIDMQNKAERAIGRLEIRYG